MARRGRSPGPRWRVRLLLCVLLGLATSWLVAWGVAVAVRTPWFGPWYPLDQRGAAYIEPLLLEYTRSQNRPTIVTLWFITPLDRHTDYGVNARIRYAAELPPGTPYPDGQPELAMRSASQFDQIAARFHELPVARHMSDQDFVVIEQFDYG